MTISKRVTPSKASAVFLDRDGVINVEVSYCHKIANFKFVPGVFDVLRLLQQQYDHLIIVTNQAGIARGYYTEDDFLRLTVWMKKELALEGINISHVYYCPHHPAGLPPYNIECDCRKPLPGMLLAAIAEYNIETSTSVLFGDKRSDLEAARNANQGC